MQCFTNNVRETVTGGATAYLLQEDAGQVKYIVLR